MKTILITLFVFLSIQTYAQSSPKHSTPGNKGLVTIVFRNLINGRPIVLNDSTYTNPFGEVYTIKKLKYYISNLQLASDHKKRLNIHKYWLINQAIDSSLSVTIPAPAGNYYNLGCLLGVDSAANTSGAQTGALDPLNDMFWTWHSGYIMQKLEGSSPQSNIVNNKFEYHIGGYEGANNALNFVILSFPAGKKLIVQKGKTSTIFIDVNFDQFWNAGYQLQISETPVCTAPGLLAKKIARNFMQLFSIVNITNE